MASKARTKTRTARSHRTVVSWRQTALLRPFWTLTFIWAALLLLWLPGLLSFSYRNTSDLGFHLYNLKAVEQTGLSFYNSQWFWGQEYLVVYSPGTALLGSLVSWIAPGIAGALIAFGVLVSLGTWLALIGSAKLAQYTLANNEPDNATAALTILCAGVFYALAPFAWRSLIHSLPDFFGYALLPWVVLAWLRLRTTMHERKPLGQPLALFALILASVALVSAIVAFHAVAILGLLLCIDIVRAFRKQQAHQNARHLYKTTGALIAGGILCSALIAFWLAPFISFTTDPNYGGEKLSFATANYGTRYLHAIGAGFTPSALAHDIVTAVSPLARHRFPLLLALLVLVCIPALRRLPKQQREQLTPFVLITGLGTVLALLSGFGTIASFGLPLLQENGRWYELAQFGLVFLAGAGVVALWKNRKTNAQWRVACAGFLATAVVLSGLALALNPPTTVSVPETLTRLQPLYAQLAQDAPGERVAEFPFLALAPSSLEHKRPMLFGSCLACNRNEKMSLMQAFEPVQTATRDGALPQTANEQSLDARVRAENLARTFGEHSTRSVVIIGIREYDALNLTVSYPLVPLLETAPGVTLSARTRTQGTVATWELSPRGGTLDDTTMVYVRGGAREVFFLPLCTLGSAVQPLQVTCTPSTARIQFGVPLARALVTTKEQSQETLVLPRGVSPVADDLFTALGPLRTVLPLVHITRGETTVTTEDRLYRVTTVEPLVSEPALLVEHTNTQYRGLLPEPNRSRNDTAYTITVREGYSPYWTATVDDAAVPVRVDAAGQGFLTFTMPANASTFTLTYNGPHSRRWGWRISGVGLVVVCLLLFLNTQNRKTGKRS